MMTISASVSLPLNPTISMLDKCRTMFQVRQIHALMIKTNLVTHTSSVAKLISVCSLSGLSGGLEYALLVILRTPKPGVSLFHPLIKGFSDSSNPFEAIVLYAWMLFCLEELWGVEYSVPSVLKACGRSYSFKEGQQILGQILKSHLWFDPFVTNSVVRMWMEIGEIDLARSVFDIMPVRDLISWNSLLVGYLRAGEIDKAREVFNEMPDRDLVSCNAMIDGCGKHRKCELAEEIFMMMTTRDVVTWTTMISAYVINNHPRKGLDLFREMLCVGIRPDAPSIVSVLSAIADLGFVEDGKWIHTYIYVNKIDHSSCFIGSALINMYAKCGQIENAYHVFGRMSHHRNTGDWNSMISGLAMHGLGHEAIKVLLDMERAELKPDGITFLGILSACNHGGLLDEGQFYFETMQLKYNIVPKIQHYGCIIDLFSRAGRLEEALGIVHSMPVEPDFLIWKAILSASMKHDSVEIGETAALQAIELAPEDSSSYVLLSNIYAKVGRWDDVAKVRSMMKKRAIRKIPGCSSILVDGEIHEFLVGKAMDVKDNEEIISKIDEIVSELKLEGYEPDLNQVLLDIEEDEKESLLTLHSEKMALAFGLLHIPLANPIYMVKNLRICCDCHSFMQLISKIYNRRIIVRDQNRFHHFEQGCCSCKGYW